MVAPLISRTDNLLTDIRPRRGRADSTHPAIDAASSRSAAAAIYGPPHPHAHLRGVRPVGPARAATHACGVCGAARRGTVVRCVLPFVIYIVLRARSASDAAGPQSVVQIAREEALPIGLTQEMVNEVEEDGEICRDEGGAGVNVAAGLAGGGWASSGGGEVQLWVNVFRGYVWDGQTP